MIKFRLREAGYRGRASLFSNDAIRQIYTYTDGYPRRIAMLCHQLLRQLAMYKGRSVEEEEVRQLVQHEIASGWSHPKRVRTLQPSSC